LGDSSLTMNEIRLARKNSETLRMNDSLTNVRRTLHDLLRQLPAMQAHGTPDAMQRHLARGPIVNRFRLNIIKSFANRRLGCIFVPAVALPN